MPASIGANARRKSGRAIQKPVLYTQDPNVRAVSANASVNASVNGSAKRKRGNDARRSLTHGGEDDEPAGADGVEDEDEEEEEEEVDGESEPDEEELKEQRRKARAGKGGASRGKPANKKPKTGQDATLELAMRPAVNGVKRAVGKSKKARTKVARRATGEGGEGLYGMTKKSMSGIDVRMLIVPLSRYLYKWQVSRGGRY